MLLTSCHLTNSTDKNNSSVGPLLHTCSLSCSWLLRPVVINDNWSMTTVHLRKAEYCSNIEGVRRQQNNGQVYAHPKLRKVNSKQDPATHDKTRLPFLPALPSRVTVFTFGNFKFMTFYLFNLNSTLYSIILFSFLVNMWGMLSFKNIEGILCC